MKLQDFLINESNDVAAMQAELKNLQKELMSAKSGGNDDVAENLRGDIAELKDKIKDAQS